MKTLTLSAVALALTLPTYSAIAGNTDAKVVEVLAVEDIGAAERVEAAALLRVLSQETASAACHMAHDINPEESRSLMVEAKGKFDLYLDALQYGNPTMNIIGKEQNRKTILQIENLREAWAPVVKAAATLIDDPKNEAALKLIKAENESVLEDASRLTTKIAGEYSNPAELMQADVMLLDFTARQAMLTQKMAKIACEIWVGNRDADRIELLQSTMQIYDLTLGALLNGMPAAGIQPAPTPEIASRLEKATQDWKVIESELEFVLANEVVPKEMKETLYHDLNVAMYDMEKIEHMYVVFAKHITDDDDVDGAKNALID